MFPVQKKIMIFIFAFLKYFSVVKILQNQTIIDLYLLQVDFVKHLKNYK